MNFHFSSSPGMRSSLDQSDHSRPGGQKHTGGGFTHHQININFLRYKVTHTLPERQLAPPAHCPGASIPRPSAHTAASSWEAEDRQALPQQETHTTTALWERPTEPVRAHSTVRAYRTFSERIWCNGYYPGSQRESLSLPQRGIKCSKTRGPHWSTGQFSTDEPPSREGRAALPEPGVPWRGAGGQAHGVPPQPSFHSEESSASRVGVAWKGPCWKQRSWRHLRTPPHTTLTSAKLPGKKSMLICDTLHPK